MNKKLIKLASFAAVLSCLLISCGHEPTIRDDDSSETTYEFYSPQSSPYTVFYEDFEAGALTARNPWNGENASLTTYEAIRSDLVNNTGSSYYSYLFEGKNTTVVELPIHGKITSSISLSGMEVNQNSILSFRYFFVGVTDSTFKVYANGKELFSVAGVNSSSSFDINTVSVKIPAGTTSITFEAKNTKNYWYTSWPNAAFIDDISLVEDKITSVIVTPRSSQKTYVGCPAQERIKVKAYALRADGSVKTGQAINYGSSNGTVSNKEFIPSSAGTCKISATCEGFTCESGEITVFADKLAEGTCTIGGVTYNGTLSDTGSYLANVKTNFGNINAKISFEYPKTNTVTADGFVRFKGKLSPSTIDGTKDFNKVLIQVKAGEDLETIYICDADFDLRVWLPFGSKHEIIVSPAKIDYRTYKDSKGKTCEGDFSTYRYYPTYKITATNTHNHTISDSGNTDGRYVYPSFECQSDNYMVQNITNEVLYNLPANASDESKFKAIHDYAVLNYYYDYDSVTNPYARKKQDAVSVIKNETCVCAGYTALTAAMSRYAGLPSKYVTSNLLTHAWNHIRLNGNWYFTDVTWDDPEKRKTSTYISYKYYLLTDYTGVEGDHGASDVKVEEGKYILPQQIIEPELPLLIREGYIF